jgi:hypothetical protein
MTNTTALFIAWWRRSRRDRWEQLAEGATHDAATGAMIDALAGKRGGESIVLAAGRHPNTTANRRASR